MGNSPKSPRVLTHSPTATVRTQNTTICRRLYVLYKMSSMRSEESSSVTSPDHAPSTTEDRASTRFRADLQKAYLACVVHAAACSDEGGGDKRDGIAGQGLFHKKSFRGQSCRESPEGMNLSYPRRAALPRKKGKKRRQRSAAFFISIGRRSRLLCAFGVRGLLCF